MKVLIYVVVIDNDEAIVGNDNNDKQILYKIGKILESHYQDCDFKVERFVELSEMRRTLFFKKVKHLTGFSPNELLKMKRLNESIALLTQNELNISEIAYKVGFDDPYYFSRCFKNHFHYSPREYRKRIVGSQRTFL